ncbi:DUF1275 family protein [Corallibacter sp.]|uniref:DUF1275 family protein n=1 Tax=Corallibacter sp. TaxID=2038084 RepID=UPI003AB79926
MSVGFYGHLFYKETLSETEIMVALMLLAMGLQNGLTASISNFSVKTTHLTGLTTDVGILTAMFTKKKYRNNKSLRGKFNVLLAIAFSYLTGGILAGVIYFKTKFLVFFAVSGVICFIILYEYYKLKLAKLIRIKRQKKALI